MSADVNDLNLREPDTFDWDEYEPSAGVYVLPPAGIYRLLPIELPVVGATQQDHYLQFELGPLAVMADGRPWDGFKINYQRVNVKPWPKRRSHGVADYLTSHGYQGRPQSNDDYIAAVQSLVNHPCVGVIDHKVYCKSCGYTLKGQDKLPKDESGATVTRMVCPNGCRETRVNEQTGEATEQAKMLFVNVEVRAFVPPERLK